MDERQPSTGDSEVWALSESVLDLLETPIRALFYNCIGGHGKMACSRPVLPKKA